MRRHLSPLSTGLFYGAGEPEYSHTVTRQGKLLARARSNPRDLSFADLQTLLRRADWTFEYQSGSHQIWYSPTGCRLSIQEGRDGKAKGYQVEQFLMQYEVEHGGE